jgi:hypothetical protein
LLRRNSSITPTERDSIPIGAECNEHDEFVDTKIRAISLSPVMETALIPKRRVSLDTPRRKS